MPKQTIACYVGHEDLHYAMAVARLSLTKEDAERLLKLRDIWVDVSRQQPRLSSIAWWDNSTDVEWGDYNSDYELDYEWGVVEFDESLWRECRTELEKVHAREDGVFWSALPKHCDNRAETAVVTWNQLEDVMRGRCPFGQEVASRPEDPC